MLFIELHNNSEKTARNVSAVSGIRISKHRFVVSVIKWLQNKKGNEALFIITYSTISYSNQVSLLREVNLWLPNLLQLIVAMTGVIRVKKKKKKKKKKMGVERNLTQIVFL